MLLILRYAADIHDDAAVIVIYAPQYASSASGACEAPRAAFDIFAATLFYEARAAMSR